ncbi:hypothetical protein FB451DRAFT_1108965 [Mycena latifolia]|nr:hypothetical protein FB451DRAFT_1108965 [Mycena latifolia]
MSCPNGGGPPMNTDISGIGVRLSFYLQTLFLGCLSTRSPSLEEVTGAFYTLLATNTGMAVTALTLGLKPAPEISFHDALVVSYLLYISWVPVHFSLPSNARFPGRVKILHLCSVVQSYTLFAFAFAMLATAPTFGSNPECNPNAVVVLFRPFSVLQTGRILFCVLTGLVFVIYTGILVNDHIVRPAIQKAQHRKRSVIQPVPDPGDISKEAADPPAPETAAPAPVPVPKTYGYTRWRDRPVEHDFGTDPTLVAKLIVILILWSLAVMNTELLIRWNHFAASDDSHSQWQFGQVLPMFLVVLSLVGVVNTFRENKLSVKVPRQCTCKIV